jgi:endonuclease/exonuclease/phosphatase family metal-dependent hydrolase
MAARSQGIDLKKLAPLAILLIILVGYLVRESLKYESHGVDPVVGQPVQPGEYLFCSWNLENLFDDANDKRNSTDEPYDNWFANNEKDRNLKFQHLAEALLKMNGGKGPDILCAFEVESKRAAHMLADALNKGLPEGAAPFSTVIMEEINAGRHIAPAIISRLPLSKAGKPRLFPPHRVLRASLDSNGAELIVFAAHWTSRLSDTHGDQRAKYADLVYGKANEVYHSDPKADIIVCGDFNDEPEDKSIREHLKAGKDLAAVRDAKELKFLNLMDGKDADKFGTHYHSKPVIYDHICVSPGLLDDRGWSCEVNSIHTVTDGLIKSGSKLRKPWRFGNEKDTIDRGYSDHFPVVVKLKVHDLRP